MNGNGTGSSDTPIKLGEIFSNMVESLKQTDLGDNLVKNFSKVMILVVVILGFIVYIDFAQSEIVSKSSNTSPINIGSAPKGGIVTKKIHMSPLPSIHEGFGNNYSRKELEDNHRNCRNVFCENNNKTPEYLEKRCREIDDKDSCMSKCCCGWVKYAGENVPKCVSGNASNPVMLHNLDGTERDVDYYYFMTKCVKGKNCPKEDRV
jgi:hypothetical protein